MSDLPPHSQPDERWCDMLASYSADELTSAKLIPQESWGLAMRIIRQQAYVLLVSNCYPAGDLNSN